MATLLEKEMVNTVAAEQEAQREHNAMIKERYRRLQNAETEQFAQNSETNSAVLISHAPIIMTVSRAVFCADMKYFDTLVAKKSA